MDMKFSRMKYSCPDSFMLLWLSCLLKVFSHCLSCVTLVYLGSGDGFPRVVWYQPLLDVDEKLTIEEILHSNISERIKRDD